MHSPHCTLRPCASCILNCESVPLTFPDLLHSPLPPSPLAPPLDFATVTLSLLYYSCSFVLFFYVPHLSEIYSICLSLTFPLAEHPGGPSTCDDGKMPFFCMAEYFSCAVSVYMCVPWSLVQSSGIPLWSLGAGLGLRRTLGSSTHRGSLRPGNWRSWVGGTGWMQTVESQHKHSLPGDYFAGNMNLFFSWKEITNNSKCIVVRFP